MDTFIHRVVNIGVRPGHPFEEQKKIRSLNAGSLLGMVMVTGLCVLNLFTAHYGLACCYLLLLLSASGIVLLQHFQQFRTARLAVIIIIAAFFSFISLGYHNNTELLLLLNVAVIVLLLRSWWLIVTLVLIDLFVFIFIHIYIRHHGPFIEPLPASREVLSAIAVFIFMAAVLLFNKYEQWRYQQQLEALNRQNEEKAARLENLNRSKEKIFSILSHDLREPLASMRSLLSLDADLAAPLFNEFAGRARNSLDNVLLSLDNTLRWSHLQLKGITVSPQYCDVLNTVQQLQVKMGSQMAEKGLAFDLQVPESTLVYADPDHLSVLLRNVLSNAVKFTPGGGAVTVKAATEKETVHIRITDTGIGMDAAIQGQLFDLERRFTRRGTENEHGAGLGLLITKELVAANSGHLQLVSQTGKGTTVTIQLPGSYA
ncbi:MAG TPA: HAMP domain-containing sensor histidine kinase [Chitinophaga sp.]|uniref:sensor histidine kinase n=1 Tax=Chitinophaga sp. TaxID=1869181 RepID=UPI002DB9BA42|nr:HAMP domain-containing sensor histidine kinase [Chitinophaga sp.]HEU4553637.1 HAMP domain-containing sensor histidine kinase [Chitinophaga sp.]